MDEINSDLTTALKQGTSLKRDSLLVLREVVSMSFDFCDEFIENPVHSTKDEQIKMMKDKIRTLFHNK